MSLYVVLYGRGGELDREACDDDGDVHIKEAVERLVERCSFAEGDTIKIERA
jgi:hypothetical protein